MQLTRIPKTIAIDGPVASGKSSVGRQVADRLGYYFLDTGIMYRAVTLATLRSGINISDEHAVGKTAERISIEMNRSPDQDGSKADILLDGEDVSSQLRSSVVNDSVSQVSRYKAVRDAMTAQQQKIGAEGSIVMVGRDIGTVVLPDADLKIFLVASPEERARRRFAEELEKGNDVSYDEILKNVKMRDKIDSNRKIAPLKPARDATIINTDGKNVDDVIEEIMHVINRGHMGEP